MQITEKELFDVLMPVLLALHEKKLLDVAELPHYYEDAVVRRRESGASEADLAYQQGLVRRFQNLADLQKRMDRRIPPT